MNRTIFSLKLTKQSNYVIKVVYLAVFQYKKEDKKRIRLNNYKPLGYVPCRDFLSI